MPFAGYTAEQIALPSKDSSFPGQPCGSDEVIRETMFTDSGRVRGLFSESFHLERFVASARDWFISDTLKLDEPARVRSDRSPERDAFGGLASRVGAGRWAVDPGCRRRALVQAMA